MDERRERGEGISQRGSAASSADPFSGSCVLLEGNTRTQLRLHEGRKQNSDVSLAARELGRAPEISEGMNEGSQREYY